MRKFELPHDAETRERLTALKEKAVRDRDGRQLCDDISMVATAIVIGVDDLLKNGELDHAHYSAQIEQRNGDFDEPEGGASRDVVNRAWQAIDDAIEGGEPAVSAPAMMETFDRDPAFQPSNA